MSYGVLGNNALDKYNMNMIKSATICDFLIIPFDKPPWAICLLDTRTISGRRHDTEKPFAMLGFCVESIGY